MDSLIPDRLRAALPAALAVLCPSVAAADELCPTGYDTYDDPCADTVGWQSLAPINAAALPSDGVLVLQGNLFGGDPEATFPTLDMTVTKVGGGPLAGSFAATELPGVVVWRPDAGWEAGATYTLGGAVQNPDAGCVPGSLPFSGEVVVDVAPAPALVAPQLEVGVFHEQTPRVELTTLACCEGATPQLVIYNCGGAGEYVEYDPSSCAPTEATGHLSLNITATMATSGPAEDQLFYVHRLDGQEVARGLSRQFVTGNLLAPACVDVEVHDLASGAVVVGEPQCFGDPAKLGPLPLDPGATLTCELFQCEPTGETWDLEKCVPFDPAEAPTTGPDSTGADTSDASGSESASDAASAGGDPSGGDKGCACAGGGGGGAELLALAGLGWLVRRRRAGR